MLIWKSQHIAGKRNNYRIIHDNTEIAVVLSIQKHELSLSQDSSLQDGLCHRRCSEPSREGSPRDRQILQGRSWGSRTRETELGAPAGAVTPGRAAGAQSPAAAAHTAAWAQICWWDTCMSPLFIGMCLWPSCQAEHSLPPLHCCHSVHYLDSFFHAHTYITKQPSSLAVF